MISFLLTLLFASLCMLPVCASASLADTSAVRKSDCTLEKVHVTTDKELYLSGDTLWMRALVVDALTHRPLNESNYLYAELLDGAGKLQRRIKIVRQNGLFAGYIALWIG